MYEFHGWIKLVESPSEVDEGALQSKCNTLRNTLNEQINWPSGRAELLLLNGVYMLVLNAVPNRRRSEADELDNLVSNIISDFKGAYGIIYEYDEMVETPTGRGIFSVRVIKRGSCEVFLDPFLSPKIPVVEDRNF